jgi:ankyrin repeat protein
MTKADALPDRPSLAYLRKLAKQQVAALRSQGKTASLAEAHLALARKYGFPSWRKLKAHVEEAEQWAASQPAAAQDAALSPFDHAMKAITSRDTSALKQLLYAEPGLVNRTGPHPRWGGQPQLLHVAIESDNLEAFQLLLKCGAGIDGDNRHYDGWSPLMISIHWKRGVMCDELIRRGANIELIAALMLGDDHRVAALAANAAALRGPFPNDASPLHFARTVVSARLLLARGVQIDARDKYGVTAPQRWADARPRRAGLIRLANALGQKTHVDIFTAVGQGRVVEARKLLSAGADVNARFSTQSGQTLLHAAAWNGDLPMVKLLLAKGADLHALDQQHETTPAHWARVAIEAFHRQSCEPVAQYLEGRMTALPGAGSQVRGLDR